MVLALLGGLFGAVRAEAQLGASLALANSGNVTVAPGGSGSTTITATALPGATLGTVSFTEIAVSGLPAGATATFVPESCNLPVDNPGPTPPPGVGSLVNPTCSALLTLGTAPTTAPGTYRVVVTGRSRDIRTGAIVTATTNVLLTVTAPPFQYVLSTSPANVTVSQGGASGTTTVTATLVSGSPQPVTLTASGLPAGATATFAQPSCTPTCSIVLTIATTAATPLGTFTITVTGSPLVGESAPTTTFTLTVIAPFNYSLAATPATVTVTAGGPAGTTTITATLLTGTTQPVTLSASGVPAGTTATFAQTSCSPTCSTVLTFTAGAAATTGTFTVTVTGNPLGRTTTVTLTVTPTFDYSLAANPTTVSVVAGGGAGSTTVTATLLTGATQPVSFAATGLPAGVSASFSQASCSPTCSTVLTFTAAPATASGTFTITVTGSPLGRTTTVTLVVGQAFNYSLSVAPATVAVTTGSSASAVVTATLLSGATQPVSFSATGLPSGVTANFSLPSCSPTCTTTLTFTAAQSAAPGTFTVTVTGNPLGRTVTLGLTVAGRTLSIVSGNNQTGVINAPLPAPLVVGVTPPEPSVIVTWTVTGGAIPSATTTPTVNGLAQITLRLGPTPGPVTVTASIVSGGIVTTSVTFVVNDATSAAVAGLKTFSVLGNLAVITATEQARNIGIRLAALRRGGGGGLSVSGLSLNVAGQSIPLAALATLTASGGDGGGGAERPQGLAGLGIFLNGQGTFGDQNGTTLEPGFKFHTEGLTLGTDYQVTENIVLGAAAGYLHTSTDLDQAGGRVKLNGYSLSAFGSYYVSDKFYLDAIATYGWNDYGVTRNVTFGDTAAAAKSDPDGHQFAISVSGGYNFNLGALTLGPTARVNYINVRIDSFSERGADLFNLRVNSQRVESLTTDLGAQLSYAISLPWGVLSPLARVEWEHQLKGGSRLITGSLVADPLRTVFGAPTNDPDRNYVNLAAGLTATLPRGASAFAHYETVVGRSHVTTHSFTAGIRFQFE